MGLNKPIPAGGVFLRILDGSIVQKSKTEKPGWELYQTINPTTQTPVEYWIERYKDIDGLLVKVERVEKPEDKVFGWKLHLLDDVEMLLDFKDGSPTTRRMLAILPNVDLDKKLTIRVFKDKEGYNAIYFHQDGVKVEQYWNKETLPAPKMIAGKANYSEAEAIVHEETLRLIEGINARGSACLAAYHDSIREAVESGTYTGPIDVKPSEASYTKPSNFDPNDPLYAPPDTTVPPPDNDDIGW